MRSMTVDEALVLARPTGLRVTIPAPDAWDALQVLAAEVERLRARLIRSSQLVGEILRIEVVLNRRNPFERDEARAEVARLRAEIDALVAREP